MPFSTRRLSTRGTPRGLLGSNGSIHAPLKVGQIISARADAESAFASKRKSSVSSMPARSRDMSDHCYSRMAADLNQTCNQHADRYDCPDALIDQVRGGYGIIVHDGGTSLSRLPFAPGAEPSYRRSATSTPICPATTSWSLSSPDMGSRP
jgi:hypothetical protein